LVPLPTDSRDAVFEKMTSAGSDLYLVGAPPIILRSPDGGTTWTNVGAGAISFTTRFPAFLAVSASAEDDVWVGGQTQASASTNQPGDGVLLHSNDSGQSWQPVVVGDANPVYSLWSIDRNRVLVATSNGEIWRTADGGTTWGPAFADSAVTILDMWGSAGEVYAVGLKAKNTGAAAGDGNDVGGDDADGGDAGATDAAVPQLDAAGAPFTGLVLRSTDAGETWNAVISEAPCQFWHVAGTDDARAVYAAGNCGTLAWTADHGASWTTTGAASQYNRNDIDVSIGGVWTSPQPAAPLLIPKLSDSTFFAVQDDVCRWVDVEDSFTDKIGCEHLPPRSVASGTETATVKGLWGKSEHDLWAFSALGLLWHRR
jgi:photosystem II stability/assembly factor-like uncharacterized protein